MAAILPRLNPVMLNSTPMHVDLIKLYRISQEVAQYAQPLQDSTRRYSEEGNHNFKVFCQDGETRFYRGMISSLRDLSKTFF